MFEPSNNLPLINPITVVGPQFCAPYPIELNIVKQVFSLGAGNFSVADVNGNFIFKVKGSLFSLHQRRFLLDANENPLLSMQIKIFSLHSRWEVFRGDSSDPKDLLFTVKRSSLFQFQTELDVFLANNIREEVCDFKIKGSWLQRSCKIYIGDSSNVIAQMHKKFTAQSFFFGKNDFMVTVYSNVDYAFVVALIVILDAINESNNRRKNSGGSGTTGAT